MDFQAAEDVHQPGRQRRRRSPEEQRSRQERRRGSHSGASQSGERRSQPEPAFHSTEGMFQSTEARESSRAAGGDFETGGVVGQLVEIPTTQPAMRPSFLTPEDSPRMSLTSFGFFAWQQYDPQSGPSAPSPSSTDFAASMTEMMFGPGPTFREPRPLQLRQGQGQVVPSYSSGPGVDLNVDSVDTREDDGDS